MGPITIEEVDKIWDEYSKYKDTAEQNEFPKILMVDMQFMPLYNDLKKNWNEHHAELFIKGMTMILDKWKMILRLNQ